MHCGKFNSFFATKKDLSNLFEWNKRLKSRCSKKKKIVAQISALRHVWTVILIQILQIYFSKETLVDKLGFVNEKKNYFCKAKIA
jgi:hypothetical protein